VADRHIFLAIFFFRIKTQYILAILPPLWPRSQEIMWATCRCGTLTDKRYYVKSEAIVVVGFRSFWFKRTPGDGCNITREMNPSVWTADNT